MKTFYYTINGQTISGQKYGAVKKVMSEKEASELNARLEALRCAGRWIEREEEERPDWAY